MMGWMGWDKMGRNKLTVKMGWDGFRWDRSGNIG